MTGYGATIDVPRRGRAIRDSTGDRCPKRQDFVPLTVDVETTIQDVISVLWN
jgi:hypothetical protein